MKRKPKDPYDFSEKSVKVRNSYYTFSKEYPAGNIEINHKRKNNKARRKNWIKIILLIVCFIAVMALSFFFVDLGLKYSNKEIAKAEPAAETEETLSLLSKGGVKGMYMPYEKLSDKKYIKSFIKEIRKKDCNSVVIDFKSDDGRIVYSSLSQFALLGKCAVFDNETVRAAIDLFNSSSVQVIARVFCFEDPLIASLEPSLAVKYLNTDVQWLDKLEEDGGKPWLNPYSSKAKNYIKELISEIYKFGVGGIILESVCFPEGENIESAVFTGEENGAPRNEMLKNFIASIRNSVKPDCFIVLGAAAQDIISVNELKYSGSIAAGASDGICADTAIRDPQFVCDRKDGYSSILSMYSAIKAKTGEETPLILKINIDEFSGKYIRALRRSGYENYILYSESGKY